MKRLLATLLLSLALIGPVAGDGIFVNDSGTLREIQKVFVNDNGTLREIQSGWINDNGTLRQFFANIVLDAGSATTVQTTDGSGGPYDTTVGIRFNTDGTVEVGTSINGAAINWTANGSWIDPINEASGDYSVRYTNRVSAGGHDFTSKAANEDSWIALSSARVWTWNRTLSLTGPNNLFTVDFEVRDDVGSADTASDEYTFRIENTL